MKHLFVVLSLLFTFTGMLILPVSASAGGESYVNEQLEQISEQLAEHIPDEAQELLESLNLSTMDLQHLLQLKPKDFLAMMKTQVQQHWQESFHAFTSILGVLFLTLLLFPLHDSVLKSNTAFVYSMVSSLSMCIILLPALVESIHACLHSLEGCASFLLVLIPILAAILSIGGHLATAGTYQLLLFGACQLVSQLTVSIATPLLSIYTALGFISAVFPNLNVQGLVNGLKKVICWSLGIATTLFVAFLSLQSFITVNLDVVTQKAGRFIMGNFVPVIGSILSDAFGAAQGCFSLIRSTVGTFGIIISLCIILPSLLQVIIWYVLTWFALQVSTLVETLEVGSILKIANNSFGILLALQLCMLLMVLVALSIVIFIGTGG